MCRLSNKTNKKVCGIYKIENLINHKCYIGQSNDVSNRLSQHRSETYRKYNINKTLYKAIEKYGIDNFTFEIIECDLPNNKLDEREIYWINYYNSYNKGYNDTLGGRGCIGSKCHTKSNKYDYEISVSDPNENNVYYVDDVMVIENDTYGIIFEDYYNIADETFEDMTNIELSSIQDGYETMIEDFCGGYDNFESWAECNLI